MIDALLKSVMPRRDISASAKLVLIELACEQDTHRACKSSMGFLAKGTGLSKATVKRAIEELHEVKAVTRKRKTIAPSYNDLNEYSVIWVNNYNRRMRWLKRERERLEVA